MPDLTLEQRRTRRRVETNVRRFALDHDLLPKGDRVLVAVSGGADSIALLMTLNQLSHRGGFGLAVAHFDHGLRGRETAEREASFVRELALSLDLQFFRGSAEVGTLARESKQSIETAAREARYAFLNRAAVEAGCASVATGHTASDQAETVLMHIIRGTGLTGLGGIAPSSLLAEGPALLVRPLLRVTREDTEAYCAAHGITPIDDESNRSPDFARNRVRHELMPLLRSFNPRVEDAFVRLADAARQDAAHLDALSSRAIEDDASCSAVRFEWNRLGEHEDALRRHGLRMAVERLLHNSEGFSERHYQSLERLVLEGQPGDRLDLPRGVRVQRERDFLLLSLAEPAATSLPEHEARLTVPGEVCFGGLTASASPNRSTQTGALAAEIDFEAAADALVVRRRRNGDRFQPLGMSGTKKLQDFFVDEHVPSSQRDTVPIFENQRGIVWVGGLRIADWAKPRPGKPTVHLSYTHA